MNRLKLENTVMICVSLILLFVFWSLAARPAHADVPSCYSGYWSIDSVTTNLDFDYPTADMGMHVEQVTPDFWVGTFYLNEPGLSFTLGGDGAGVLNITAFDGFLGTTRSVSESVYFIPEEGEAGFSRPGLWQEFGIWHCVLSDYCVRQFTISQLTFPQGECE